jgi:hypothetical protein
MPGNDEPANPLGIPDDKTLDALLRCYATQEMPRLFALCEVAKEWRSARAVAWGMSFADQAVVYSLTERTIGVFTSARRAAELFAGGRDVRLIWPDVPPLRASGLP